MPYIEYFYAGIVSFEIGEQKLSKTKLQAAIGNFDGALKLYPKFADAQFYKAAVLIDMGMHADALSLLNQAKNNLSQNYTINEDNSKYELYLYQVSSDLVETYINWIARLVK